jgi:two-component system, cell cycle response regulator CpdR
MIEPAVVPREHRVLVIEDHTMIRQLVSLHLRGAGFEVVEVATVRAAVEALGEHSYDLIVSDVHLPDGDSIPVLHDTYDLSPGVSVIFITGDESRELAEQITAEVPAGFFVKPFDFTELVQAALHAVANPQSAGDGHGRRVAAPIRLLRSPVPDHRRGMPLRTIIKMAIVVGLMLAAAFLIGHELGELQPADEAAATTPD